MIKSIDIPNFGSFKDFVWRDSIRDGGNVMEFKRLNIIYGRNYSGKTTLSKILRCFQEQKLPNKYKKPCFTITTDSGTLNQTQIASHQYDIRVYNKDFVDENLSFLRDHDEGEIKTFAIIGGENVEIEKLIANKEEELGSIEAETGLKSKHAKKASEFTTKKTEAGNAENALTARLRRRANDEIKHNRVYGHAGYNLNAIEQDIKAIRANSTAILDDEQVRERNDLLKEEELADIVARLSFTPRINILYEQARNLLTKEIAPTEPIQDLLNDAILQAWVKSGIPYHRDKRETCGFCRQPLPDALWKELDAHFSKESSDLDEGLKKHIETVEAEIESIKTVMTISRENFYTSKRAAFDELKKALDEETKAYEKELNSIVKALRSRRGDIFKPAMCADPADNTGAIAAHISAINNLIVENNEKTKSLAADKKMARIELRINDVAHFIQDIDLGAEEKKNHKLSEAAEELGKEAAILQGQVTALVKDIESHRIKQKDEKAGSEKINEFLNHFFGHDGLRLEAIEDAATTKFKFQITRGMEPAYNLSEGECSLVSFCYFLAKLEDADTKGKELLIYIDDPISSLDSNHIFFVYSLIESVLTKPKKKADGSNEYRYRQLFISTHNLDFFKYLKRLSIPRKKEQRGEKIVSVDDSAYFIIELSTQGSQLSLMPAYLKDYTTEFNYLFNQIYKCRNADYAKVNHECFYSFGNNLRKFLEAYLFYKYPCHFDNNDTFVKLTKFFGEDSISTALTNRVSNELSHLEEIFDRSMRPIEIPEIPSLANFILNKIYEKDRDQYNSLLKSIGEPPREDTP